MNIKKAIRSFLYLCIILPFSACSDDDTAYVDNTIKYDSEMSSHIDWIQNDYSINITKNICTPNELFSYRVKIDDDIIKEEIDINKDIIEYTVGENITPERRYITIEVKEGNSEWKIIKRGWQKAGLEKIGNNYWTKGNLTTNGEKFIISPNKTDYGLLFKHKSSMGIKTEGETYSGNIYNPKEQATELSSIAIDEKDPCIMASDGYLRMPTQGEIKSLIENMNDFPVENDGVLYWSAYEGKISLPFAGTCSDKGILSGKNEFVSYWTSSINKEGKAAAFKMSINKEELECDLEEQDRESFNAIRCVRNLELPSYVSHTPTELISEEGGKVTVVTKPSGIKTYTVELIADDGTTIKTEATIEEPTATLNIPNNEGFGTRIFTIYINGEFTGKTITQPGRTNYAIYESHTPNEVLSTDQEFTLNVTIKTDLNDVPIEIKGEPNFSAKATASKSNPTVQFKIPRNKSKLKKEYHIWINNKDTKVTVTQQATTMKVFMVEWSKGYINAKDNEFVFGEKGERPLFFNKLSPYGLSTAISKYGYEDFSGYAYMPEKVEYDVDNIPSFEKVDPCSLVVPKDTWRMPTRKELEDLITFDSVQTDEYVKYIDEETEVYFYTTGYMRSSGSYGGESYIQAWTSTKYDRDQENNQSYIIYSRNTEKIASFMTGKHTDYYAVRCVKDK